MPSRRHEPVPSTDESSDDDSDWAPSSSDDDEKSETASNSSRSSASSASSSRGGSDDEKAAVAVHQPGKRRKRKKVHHHGAAVLPPSSSNQNTPVVVALVLLICLAVGAAVYFYVSSSSSSSASDAESTSANDTGSADGAGAGRSGGTATKTSSTGKSSATATALKGSSSGTAATDKDSSASAMSKTRGEEENASSSSSSDATATSAASASASTSSMKTCKKGVGYNDASFTTAMDICWAANWNSQAGGDLSDGVMYVPMLWGPTHVDGWQENAEAAIAAGATHVLGMNEPDLPEQANMAPAVAASLYSSAILPLATAAKLVSPAVTNGVALDNGSSMGVPWMKEFLGNCSDCEISAIALHWYDSAGNTAYFTSYLEDAYSQLNLPIWLTEFAGTGTTDEQVTFFEFAVPYLEGKDWIEKYAAFGAFWNNSGNYNLNNEDGSLNDPGTTYSETT
ncbi:hypothetical protein JCM8547_001619 [Rhodosporidiobolus lusitaniae]